jgi:Helix-turn-helix domain
MSPQNGKSALPRQENALSKLKPEQDTKESRILTIMRAGQSLNRFEAERLGDHCLHSTIATLRSKGYLFHDTWEWIPTRFGKEVHVKRYCYIGVGA